MMRSIQVESRFLHLPVKTGAPKVTLTLAMDGEFWREFEVELTFEDPDFWVFLDLHCFQGSTLEIQVEAGEDVADSAVHRGLAAITQDEAIKGEEPLYEEKYRPQFHFSSRRGWLNDPNGLVYYKGEYHLFYQHNPFAWKWGNMHWGHAVSTDLLHWEERDDALWPDAMGTMFSGSGVVDWANTAGLQTGEEPPLILFYTAAGGTSKRSEGKLFTQCMAFSNDRGQTWTKYAANPILGHVQGDNRDPKVFWHQPTSRWVMALYLDQDRFALYGSPDLKRWTLLSLFRLPGCMECPDLLELPIDGDPKQTRWVFWAANGSYVVGDFDGTAFTAETEVLRAHPGGHSYAAQSWSGTPDGRRIQISWATYDLPGMPFNQFMTFPCELGLRTTEEGLRLSSRPVGEIEKLRVASNSLSNHELLPGQPLLVGQGELLDILIIFEPGQAQRLLFDVRGVPLIYDVKRQELSCLGKELSLPAEQGRVTLRLLVDRTSVEIFGNEGLAYLPLGVLLEPEKHAVYLFAEGGPAKLVSLAAYRLRGVWDAQYL